MLKQVTTKIRYCQVPAWSQHAFGCAPNAKTYFNVFNITANVAPPDPLEQPEYCRLCIAIIVVRRLKCKMCGKRHLVYNDVSTY